MTGPVACRAENAAPARAAGTPVPLPEAAGRGNARGAGLKSAAPPKHKEQGETGGYGKPRGAGRESGTPRGAGSKAAAPPGRAAPSPTAGQKQEFLARYQNCEREIRRTEEELALWRSRAERVTASCHAQPGGGRNENRMQHAVDEIAALREALGKTLHAAAATRAAIGRAIAAVPEERLRLLLEYRYVEGLTFEAVAGRMGVSFQWACTLHKKALELVRLPGERRG